VTGRSTDAISEKLGYTEESLSVIFNNGDLDFVDEPEEDGKVDEIRWAVKDANLNQRVQPIKYWRDFWRDVVRIVLIILVPISKLTGLSR
jgi:hypothetical protein